MAKITREEVLKIARMSHITIHEQEIDLLVKELEGVLTYAERVKDLASAAMEEQSTRAINVVREDLVVPTPAEPILAQAPERQERYFVVPAILESNS